MLLIISVIVIALVLYLGGDLEMPVSSSRLKRGDKITFTFLGEKYYGEFIRYHSHNPDICSVKSPDAIYSGQFLRVWPNAGIIVNVLQVKLASLFKEDNPNAAFRKV